MAQENLPLGHSLSPCSPTQVWCPGLDARTGTCSTLRTKGEPWELVGPEDCQLQTFRALSTEVAFCASREDSASFGTVGRAFKQREVRRPARMHARPAAPAGPGGGHMAGRDWGPPLGMISHARGPEGPQAELSGCDLGSSSSIQMIHRRNAHYPMAEMRTCREHASCAIPLLRM